MPALKWTDTEDIALELLERMPRWIRCRCGLPTCTDGFASWTTSPTIPRSPTKPSWKPFRWLWLEERQDNARRLSPPPPSLFT